MTTFAPEPIPPRRTHEVRGGLGRIRSQLGTGLLTLGECADELDAAPYAPRIGGACLSPPMAQAVARLARGELWRLVEAHAADQHERGQG